MTCLFFPSMVTVTTAWGRTFGDVSEEKYGRVARLFFSIHVDDKSEFPQKCREGSRRGVAKAQLLRVFMRREQRCVQVEVGECCIGDGAIIERELGQRCRGTKVPLLFCEF